MMNSQEIDKLITKYLNNTATDSEREKLLGWYRSNYPQQVTWSLENESDEEELKQRILSNIITHVKSKDPNFERNRTPWAKIAVAATILVISATTLYFWPKNQIKQFALQKTEMVKPFANNTQPQKQIVITPGKHKAILTLANGTKVILDDAKNGIISKQGNVIIQKNKEGQIIYRAVDGEHENVTIEESYNTITTPRGGMFQVVLPDNSKVWLNTASSLKFPSTFNGTERKVELTGEAYFEVAKNNDVPFKVVTDHTVIEVLGTHFNVMAYKDENKGTVTTLLEGSVKIIRGRESQLLVPGEQAEVKNSISTSTVNTSEIVEWKNGNFNFSHESIETIMNKISRWYNVDIEYQGEVTEEGFVGTVPQDENIHEVLKRLELTGLVHFEIVGRRVIVMP